MGKIICSVGEVKIGSVELIGEKYEEYKYLMLGK